MLLTLKTEERDKTKDEMHEWPLEVRKGKEMYPPSKVIEKNASC